MASSKQHIGLGRGLGELLQRTDPDAYFSALADHISPGGARFAELPVDSVHPNPRQPREAFDDDALAELADSIKEVGLLQPIVVRPIEVDEQGRPAAGSYELVMGERRLRASKQAGVPTIPAIIRRTEDADLLRDALLENLHRAQLNPLEEAAAYQQLMSDFGCTQEELSARIKRSRPHISNTIRLLHLPPAVQRKVGAGVLSAGHARALLTLPEAGMMEVMADRIIAEGLSVRSVEEMVLLASPQPDKPRRAQPDRPRAPQAAQFEAELGEALDTRVRISGTARRGKIIIDYAGAADLERLRNLLIR